MPSPCCHAYLALAQLNAFVDAKLYTNAFGRPISSLDEAHSLLSNPEACMEILSPILIPKTMNGADLHRIYSSLGLMDPVPIERGLDLIKRDPHCAYPLRVSFGDFEHAYLYVPNKQSHARKMPMSAVLKAFTDPSSYNPALIDPETAPEWFVDAGIIEVGNNLGDFSVDQDKLPG